MVKTRRPPNESVDKCHESAENFDFRTTPTTSTIFFHVATVSAHKPDSFWREKHDTVVILPLGFAKLLSCENK